VIALHLPAAVPRALDIEPIFVVAERGEVPVERWLNLASNVPALVGNLCGYRRSYASDLAAPVRSVTKRTVSSKSHAPIVPRPCEPDWGARPSQFS
jgi:hypothetical protein